MRTAQKQPPLHDYEEFWKFYLSQHSTKWCRRFHVFGATAVFILLAYIFVTGHWRYLPLVPVVGYGLAWIGHFVFEKNRPASWLGAKAFYWSLISEFRLAWFIYSGRIQF
eukprot:TRINITY_DN4523_c0_g3_i1.p1 TRINITY_DN4523_c0_g3~~TRINITY_DN4523_c0_g3_i1.p1  ORF type:complete len:110 (-),score=6.03 TRINITY_DN4523_c0_g3_i1:79-408(-)